LAYRVLVVEDDPAVQLLLRELLSEAGYQVDSAGDGVEALEVVVQRLPDIVLSDVLMPRMTGLELCALLKENPRTQQLPVIFLTCVDDPVGAFDVGADDFVPKPFRAQELLARMRALLRRTSFLPSLASDGLRGRLTDLALPDLLQALHLASASGCLTVVRPQPPARARLWMSEGRLAAAVLDGENSLAGRAAMIELVTWDEALFSFDSGETGQWQAVLSSDQAAAGWLVEGSIESLLLDAIRLKDERAISMSQEPAGGMAATSFSDPRAGEAGAHTDNVARRIDEFRTRLKVKAFQALVEGGSPISSGTVRPSESPAGLELPPELDELIERMLSSED
jgi:CheY-like chemotaxis protein